MSTADSSLLAHLALEHDGWKSLCSGHGGTFYGELMTPQAVMILVNGAVMDRATIQRTLDQAPPWASYELSDTMLIPLGPDANALVYRAVASRDGDVQHFEALMTSVYQRVDGRLRLALYQQTAVPN